ncbi:MAG TPA: AMP-binding protein [Streptosporangiaceae bacterium]|nr:AMP-binding protein [Streptosporangiaceae bacterium]
MSSDEMRRQWRADWRASGVYSGLALFDHVTRGIEEHGDDLQVFVDEHGRRRHTIGDLYSRALSVATAIGDAGLGPGDAVAVHMAHTPDAIVAYLAVSAAGATLVPIPSIYSDRETRFILADSRARMLITAASWRGYEYLPAIPGYQADGLLEHVVVAGGDPQDYTSFSDLLAAPARARPDLSPLAGERTAAIIYTSGSTANPKGVMHSDDTLFFEAAQSYPPTRMAGSTWLNATPAGHMGGYLAALKSMLFGRPCVWMERWNPDLALDLIREYRVSHATLVPFHLMTVLEAMNRADLDRLDLRDVLCGSTTVPTELIEEAVAKGIGAYRCYGSTEHPTISKSGPDAALADRSLTDGLVLPGLTVRIVDEAGAPLPDDGEGEILTRGPDQMLGYTSDAENAAAFTGDGFFRTGDIGRLDAGVLTITGRKKEVIIRGGENISVREVEELLRRHPAVREAAVVPRSHDRYGEQVWAFVRTRGNQQLTVADVRKLFRDLGVARQKTPEGVVVVDEFPRTPAGKISKRDLRESLAT